MRWTMLLLALTGCWHESSSPPAPAQPTPAPSTGSPPASGAPGLRAKQLIDHPDNYVDKDVTVDLYESMLDSDHSSLAGPGEWDVEVEDVGAQRFKLVPGTLDHLPTDVHPPIRVQGKLATTQFGLKVEVASLGQLTLPAPAHLSSAGDLLKDPKRWAGQYVQVDDDYLSGFEASLFGHPEGGIVWLDFMSDVVLICEPKQATASDQLGETERARLRVTGWAYTQGQYGHLGRGKAEIVATRVEWLSPRNCK